MGSQNSSTNTGHGLGFTLVEVMIALLIAAAIVLLVFLAVPALLRNERNRERRFDAGQIASLTRECLVRSKWSLTECDTMTEVGITEQDLRLTNDVIYCGSGGNAVDTRCTDSYSHPSGAYPVVLALSSYNNDTLWSISTTVPFMIVNYGKACNNNVLHPTKAAPAASDFAITVVFEQPRPTTRCYTT